LSGFVLPVIILGGNENVSGWIISGILILCGEIIDRLMYYNELEIEHPFLKIYQDLQIRTKVK